MMPMKIISQKREGNKVFLEVEEDYSRFQQAVQKTMAEAGKEVKVPGFRPGKAPKEMIEKALDRDFVEHRAAQALIAEVYPELIDAGKFEPVDYPSVEITRLEAGKPFQFKVAVDVYPETKLGKYKGLKVEKKAATVSEEEVLAILGRLQERFTVTDAAGQKTVLPLDDEFAKKVSKYGTLAELKAEVRAVTLRDKVTEADGDVRDQLLRAVSAETQAEVPPAMTERETDVIIDELHSSLSQSGLTLDDYLKGSKKTVAGLRQELAATALMRVKGKIALKAVAAAEQITVTPAELEAEIKEMLVGMGEDPAQSREKISPEMITYMQDYLLRKKALEFVLAQANVKEIKEEQKS